MTDWEDLAQEQVAEIQRAFPESITLQRGGMVAYIFLFAKIL
jgi:hypothetical protein